MKPPRICFLLALAAVSFVASPVRAHVTLEHPAALASSHYKATFKVGHGCGASPTRQFIVQMPEGVRGARPMPKPGWDLQIERGPLAQPHESHGRRITEDVQRITWTARTPADMLLNAHYDEFVLQAQLPARAGPMYWFVSQVCPEGRLDWHETPSAAKAAPELKSPAPLLDILPATGGHTH